MADAYAYATTHDKTGAAVGAGSASALYNGTDKISVELQVYASDDVYVQMFNYLNAQIKEACKGTPLEGKVELTMTVNPDYYKAIAAGTADKVAEVEEAIKNGTLHVFDTTTWTVGGAHLDSYKDDFGNEYISDGYFHESELASAPAFNIIIDGVTATK